MITVTDPASRIWKPKTSEQEEFMALPDTIFEGFFGGSVKCGKTELLLMMPLALGLYKVRRFKGLMLRRTFPELESEVLHRAKEYYPSTGAVWKDKIKAYEWPEFNSRMRFGHAQHEKDIKDYDSDEYQYFDPDELTSFTEFMYLYIGASRVRALPDTDLRPIIRSGGMPGGRGHGWVRKRFIEPCKEGRRILEDKDGNKRIFIKATPFRDFDPQYYDRLKLLPRAEYLAKMGDWWTFSGQVFEDWRIEPLLDEPDNARHVVEQFTIPKWWKKIFAMDVGYKTYALWGAISPDERLYIYREKLFDKATAHEYGSYVGEVSANDGKFIDVVLDHTAWDARTGVTDADLFRKYSGLTPRPADKGQGSRVAGKQLLQDLIRWRGNFETPIPRLQVMNNCEELINTIPNCVYAKKDGIELDDIEEFPGDEPIDTVRYLSRAFINLTRSSQKEFKEYAKTAEIERKRELTGDMTSYYRAMEKLEASKPHSVRRRSIYGRRRLA